MLPFLGVPGRVASALWDMYDLYQLINGELVQVVGKKQGFNVPSGFVECSVPTDCGALASEVRYFSVGAPGTRSCDVRTTCRRVSKAITEPMPIVPGAGRYHLVRQDLDYIGSPWAEFRQFIVPAGVTWSIGEFGPVDAPVNWPEPETVPWTADPWQLPINAPVADAPPLPQWTLPYRDPYGDPNRSPMEQPHRGPLPPARRPVVGFYLDPRFYPWPPVVQNPEGLPGVGVIVSPGEAVPGDGDGEEPGDESDNKNRDEYLRHPSVRWRLSSRSQTWTKTWPSGKKQTRLPSRPGIRTKERKIIVAINGVVATIVNTITEGDDLIDALWKALPKRFRSKGKVTAQQKLADIYKHYGEVDLVDAVYNIIANQIEDAAYGKLGKLGAKAARRSADTGYNRRSVGYQFGDRYRPKARMEGTFELPDFGDYLPSFSVDDAIRAVRRV